MIDLKTIKRELFEKGLTSEEVEERLKKFGKNELPEGKKETLIQKFINQFTNFLIIILIFASIVSAVFGELIDSIVILAIVILNAILGVVQERRAENALEKVKKLTTPTSTVLRDGKVLKIPSSEIVPLDILLLEAGDKIQADGIVIKEVSLFVDESMLTGESVPVKKSVCTSEPTEDCKVYMGTTVVKGKAKVLVTETGINTELGKIAEKISETKKEKTPLEVQLDNIGKLLGILFLIVSAVVFLLGWIRGGKILDMLLTSVSLAVAAIPEGLPAVVTIVLAIGVYEMAKRNAVIRNLPAVETLGAVTYICSDKTGTLTQNKMQIIAVFEDGKIGNDLNISERLKQAMILCNDAEKYRGDPTEIALIDFVDDDLIKETREKFERISEIPFTSESKRMTTIHKFGENFLVVSKGAAEVILELSKFEKVNSIVSELSSKRKQELLNIVEENAAKGLRILAFADKVISNLNEAIEQDLVFLGFVMMKDPLRSEVKEAIDKCRSAGIRPVMITGDHPITAYAIAKELDFPEGVVLTSKELESISDEELTKIVENVTIFARINPLDKLRIVEALQRKNEVVAMTGDGVNDAPALKKADIGVSMGLTGTEVAKEASDMVLLDDNFATLVSAVFQGRTIFENIRKFIVYLLSCNIAEVMVMFFALLLGYPPPLLPLHLLWLNLVTDSFPALALGMEKGEEDLMKRPPRGKKESILTKYHYSIIITQSIAITIATLLGFILSYKRTGNLNEARTIAYMVLVISELLRAYSGRSFEGYLFKIGIFSNSFMNFSFIFGIVLLFATIYVPQLRFIFKNTVPTIIESLDILLLATLPLVISEFSKIIRKDEYGR
ncbi:cation-translocating P-type ATPase [Caldisericum exile]|uniref:Cation-transporting ATPase n=1 Tax=Caldisericum exile (strain DSM 21853 / NBRC 104410 / AZM16c01) TaxID=511051 RepID=A0A7U6JG15_CALEA|nr:cation-translocating P-type ATPase [Caldisericum exile]BAL80885.1 cation-transporting ATPase [Caldisericum exile AZM16c01]